jgi:hypothetical protein
MRACLVNKEGHERWEDDNRETPAEVIHVVENTELIRHYAYAGDFNLKHHTFRRYQEIVTEAVQ